MSRDIQVVVAMPPACFKHPVAERLFANAPSGKLHAVQCQLTGSSAQASHLPGMLLREFHHRKFYQNAVEKVKKVHRVDIAVITMFEDATILSGLAPPDLGNIPWIGFVMRQKFHFNAMNSQGPPNNFILILKRKLFIRLLKQLRRHERILTIDETLKQFIDNTYPTLKQRISYVPDPVDNRGVVTNPDLRRELSIPDDAFVILAYGSLRKGKGVELLLDVMHELPDNVHVLLAGTQAPDIKACVNDIRHRPLFVDNRIHQVDRYIDVSEDPNFFTPADVVWIAYQNYFAMSAVMVQAAQYRKPTIATSNGVIGALTKQYQTGYFVDTTDATEPLNAIRKLMNCEFVVSEQDYAAFATDYSLSAFEERLMKSLDEVTAR